MPIKKYLAKFESTSDYNTFAESNDYITPNVSAIYGSNIVFYNPYVPPHDYSQDYLTFESLESGTFAFTNAINYSIDDGETWRSLSANTNTPTLSAGDKIMFKATLTPTSSNGIGKFSSTGEFNVMGNVMSLLYGDNFIGKINLTGKNYAFLSLFKNCTKLINTENLVLPATTLAMVGCYIYMFQGCTSLTTAPELPATRLEMKCYQSMFQGCTSLTTAPELPATILNQQCYQNMFEGCTGLTSIPTDLLQATTLVDSCYSGMFIGCTSLTTAPQLPATTLAQNCYEYMFYNCTSLNSITMLATNISASDCLKNWVSGVSSSGTFTKASSMTSLPSGVTGIPSGWTVQDYVAS